MHVSEAAYEGHCRHIDRALSRFEDGQFDEALAELDMALEFCDSPNARWNRAQALLALGRYREGWDGYAARWQLFPGAATERGAQLRRDLPEWRGERLRGKRLVVIHEAGHNALYSLQAHDREAAEAHGVAAPRYGDFADVAAVASLMNKVVSIDTAALHVAGAIGHPDVTALLPPVPCWRWHNGNPWYPNIKARTWQPA